MKKKYYALTLLLSGLIIGGLVSCNNNENPGIDENVTKVLVSGPYSVEVGKSITLIASVQGTSDNRVTWSVNDTSIASITDEGVLTGLKEGEVEVKATSLKDPNFYGTWNVKVNEVQASGIEIVIDTSNNDIYEEDGIYYIPGGVEFYITYSLKGGSKLPDSVSYNFSFVDQNENTTASDCVIKPVIGPSGNYDSAIVKFNRAFEGGIITASASYLSSVSADMKASIFVNSYDKNGENTTNLLSILENISLKEKSNLLSGVQEIKQGETTTTTTFNSYLDATYSKKEITSKDSLVNEEYAYSTLDEEKNIFYYFSYNKDKTINEIFVNETFISENLEKYQNNVSKAHFMVDGIPTYGFANLLSLIFTTNYYQGETSFGDFTMNSNASYTFNANQVKVNTLFTNDLDIEVKVNFELNYNALYEISSYKYEVFTKRVDEEELTLKYEENGKDFVYGEKTLDTTKEVSLSDYYVTSFKIKFIDNYAETVLGPGADNSRYEYISFTPNGSDNRDLYIASYDHTIPLQISDYSPSSASFLIDVAKVTSLNSVAGSRNFVVFEDGSILISAPKDEEGYFIVSEDVVTIETRGGAVETIVINWTKPELKGLNFDCPQDKDVNSSRQFTPIRPYKETPYFWLNADPDDAIYSFNMKIVSGNSSGIKFISYESDKNIPNGSYTIQGLIPGDYEFYFYVEGYDTIKTENYTLTVLEPISIDTYKQNLIGQTYIYKTDAMECSIYFENDHNIILTTPNLTTVGGNITDSVNISYTISEGRVSITPDVVDGETKVNQIFDSETSYFESAYADDLIISEDFSNVKINMRLRSDSQQDTYNYHYAYYTFSLPADLSDLTNKSFSCDSFLLGKSTMTNLVISFNENNVGTMILKELSTNDILANLSFSYLYDSTLASLEISNVTFVSSSVEGLVYVNSELNDNILRIKFDCPTGFGYSLSTIYTFDLTSPL